MKVKKLSGSERYDAYLISAYCFHSREENVEQRREEIEKATDEDWGALTEDGILAARIINNHFEFFVDGQPVKAVRFPPCRSTATREQFMKFSRSCFPVAIKTER